MKLLVEAVEVVHVQEDGLLDVELVVEVLADLFNGETTTEKSRDALVVDLVASVEDGSPRALVVEGHHGGRSRLLRLLRSRAALLGRERKGRKIVVVEHDEEISRELDVDGVLDWDAGALDVDVGVLDLNRSS